MNKRWNVTIEPNSGRSNSTLYYENVKRLVISDSGVLSFETTDGKTILTTLPYHVEELA